MQDPVAILKQYWGYTRFRPLQQEIINTVMSGRDTIALLPTGGGKSLCFQVPALMLPGLTIVVSPLVSLMADQVQQLLDRGIGAAYIHSGLTHGEISQILEQALAGTVKILYVSPERLHNNHFTGYLPRFNLSLIAVDEAHCISQWGHDFRPEYLQISTLRDLFPDVPTIALTASATNQVLEDLARSLQLQQALVFRNSFERKNLLYRVIRSPDKITPVIRYFEKNQGCGIVYCRSRSKTEETARLLVQQGISAIAYHAGMPQEKRSEAQEAWMKGSIRVIVATSAFGMGIDKADVRSVLHMDVPEHPEAYYQETGRAGRDSNAAEAITLYSDADLRKLQESTALYFPPDAFLRQVYQSVCEYLQIPTGNQPDDYFDFDLNDFLARFRLEAVPATHALRLLAQEELWTLSESLFRPATIRFTVGRQTLDNINEQYPEFAMVITGLLRIYSGIFSYATTFNLFSFARQLRLPAKDIELRIRQLHQMNVLEFIPAREGPQLHFHHYRVDSKHLHIDHKRISILRENHRRRTEAMIAYLSNEHNCRNRVLLAYFSEQAAAHCGHCDICLAAQNRETPELRNSILTVLQTQQRIKAADLVLLLAAPEQEVLAMIRELIEEAQLSLDDTGHIIFISRH